MENGFYPVFVGANCSAVIVGNSARICRQMATAELCAWSIRDFVVIIQCVLVILELVQNEILALLP